MNDLQNPASQPTGLSIFRFADAPTLDKASCMTYEGITPEVEANIIQLSEAGNGDGYLNRVLFVASGLSLTYLWLKSDYRLPRHSHDGDCLYYIVAGSLHLGTERLGRGDGFFLPGGTAYAYTAGSDGVEVLEFRTCETFNLKWLSSGANFWASVMATTENKRESWKRELPPSGARD